MPNMIKRLPAQKRRESILKAVLCVLSKDGYAGLTTARVARTAGITEPILYRHFSSKETMVRALLDEVIHKMMTAFQGLVRNETDPTTALYQICRGYPKLAQRYRREFDAINQTLVHSRDPFIRKMLLDHYSAYHAFLSALIENGQQTGAFRKEIPASIAAWHIIHTALGFLMIKNIRSQTDSLKDFETLTDVTLRGLIEKR